MPFKPEDPAFYGARMTAGEQQALSGILAQYIHNDEPAKAIWIEPPEHLRDHPFMTAIQKLRETGDKKYLDEAGQHLCPSDKPFGWYLLLFK